MATVDLPDAERPVSQMVRPFWPRRLKRSWRESDGCQVMLLREESSQRAGAVSEGEELRKDAGEGREEAGGRR